MMGPQRNATPRTNQRSKGFANVRQLHTISLVTVLCMLHALQSPQHVRNITPVLVQAIEDTVHQAAVFFASCNSARSYTGVLCFGASRPKATRKGSVVDGASVSGIKLVQHCPQLCCGKLHPQAVQPMPKLFVRHQTWPRKTKNKTKQQNNESHQRGNELAPNAHHAPSLSPSYLRNAALRRPAAPGRATAVGRLSRGDPDADADADADRDRGAAPGPAPDGDADRGEEATV